MPMKLNNRFKKAIVLILILISLSVLAGCREEVKIIPLPEEEKEEVTLEKAFDLLGKFDVNTISSIGFNGSERIFALYPTNKAQGLFVREPEDDAITIIHSDNIISAAFSEEEKLVMAVKREDGTISIIYEENPYTKQKEILNTANVLSSPVWISSDVFCFVEKSGKNILYVYDTNTDLVSRIPLAFSDFELYSNEMRSSRILSYAAGNEPRCMTRTMDGVDTVFFDLFNSRRYLISGTTTMESMTDRGILYIDNIERLCLFDMETKKSRSLLSNVKLYSATGDMSRIAWVEKSMNADMLYVFLPESGENFLVDMRSEIASIYLNSAGDRLLIRYSSLKETDNASGRSFKYAILYLS